MFGIFGDNKSETEEINIVKKYEQCYCIQRKKNGKVTYLNGSFEWDSMGFAAALRTLEYAEEWYQDYLNSMKPIIPEVIKKLK